MKTPIGSGAAEAAPAGSVWRADLAAGVSMAGLLLPEAVAYSGIAGMPPQAGVIALFAGLLVYGLIGRSRFAIVSATSSSAAVLGASTLALAGTDVALRLALAAGLVIATGLAFLAAGATRLGSICSFISKPVLRGFSFGLALSIVIKQLPKMTGTHPSAISLPAYAWELVAALPHWNGWGLGFGLVAFLALKAVERIGRLPGALFVIVAGIALGQQFHVAEHGVSQVGTISLALSAPSVPHLDRARWLNLSELALAMVLLLFAESYGAIRAMALKHGDPVSPNRDLWALGAANLLSGLFQGMPVGSGYSGTSANEAAGAQSRKAAWVAAAVVLLLVALFLPWIERTPEPVLAAVVVHAVWHTLSLDAFRPYFAWRRDRLVVVSAALAVILLGVLDGLLAGVAISVAMTLRGLSEPLVTELGRQGEGHDFLSLSGHPEVRRVPGMLLLRPEAPLFFANVERVLAEVRSYIAAARPSQLVLSLEETPDLDGTTIEALAAFAADMAVEHIQLSLARLKDPVLALLQGSPATRETLLQGGSVDDAVEALSAASRHPAPA